MKDVLHRRDFLKAVGAATIVGSARVNATQTVARRRTNQPNVVLVMTDDQGYGDLGCHGNAEIKTPNLDSLHTQSVRLTNFHVGPTCAPTRAALMTGRYCNRTGVWHTVMGRSLLRKDEVTMADVFSTSGYRTGIFGKWHLGDNYPFRPQERGFDEVLIHGGGGVGQTPDYWGNDYFDDVYLHNGKREKFAGYCTDVWFDGAMKFIEANKDRPFFCYVPTNAPHSPYNVADKYSKPYRDRGIEEGRAAFYGMVTNIDDNMARLMRRLRDLGLERDTILIFMTDNGTSGGHGVVNGTEKGHNSGMRGRKGSEYDGGHRVPCFIRWPGGGLSGARDIARVGAHIDLLPTLIELCGLREPAGVEFDGDSLVPLLKDGNGNWPDRTLVTDSQRIEDPEKWRKSAVMTDRWRLVNGKELYDINADPGQEEDLAEENSGVVTRLRKAYDDWWSDTSKRFGEYCEIIIGSDNENPSVLTCHDWHSIEGVRQAHSNQAGVRDGEQNSGFWAVEIARDGEYEFSLRRWPAEVDAPINAAIPGGKAINATRARLKIAHVDSTVQVRAGARAVTFKVRLKAGKTRLQTWFTNDRGDSWGAYYLYVKRL
jgi:arylsulfatase A-like enzyme